MLKGFKAPGYNMLFNTETGTLARWGNTRDEDPAMCPVGPEIADIEISTVCHGIGKTMAKRVPCSFCYKSNTGVGENMSFDTFKKVLKHFPKTLTQIAFGIGDLDGNPDMFRIMEYCRSKGVVPNVTTNGMGINDVAVPYMATYAQVLARTCGAVAVSHYGDYDLCFGAIEALSNAGLKQVNIHKLLSKETFESCFDLIDAVKADDRARGLKAIVFLALKQKGDRNRYHPITDLRDYENLLRYASEMGVNVGMDSCSAPMALKVLDPEQITFVEPCESTLFSIYVNAKGELFPCSFTEGTPGWETGVNLATDDKVDFWQDPRVVHFRNGLMNSSMGKKCDGCSVRQHCRSCPVYDITPCHPKPHLNPKLPVIQ